MIPDMHGEPLMVTFGASAASASVSAPAIPLQLMEAHSIPSTICLWPSVQWTGYDMLERLTTTKQVTVL